MGSSASLCCNSENSPLGHLHLRPKRVNLFAASFRQLLIIVVSKNYLKVSLITVSSHGASGNRPTRWSPQGLGIYRTKNLSSSARLIRFLL